MKSEMGESKMLDDKYKDFLLSVYTESNNHLRDQTTKRDQVIAFYITVLAFFLSTYESLTNLHSTVIINTVFGVLVMLGIICFLNLSRLRSWHSQYSQCCSAISKLMVTDENINNYDDLTRFIRANNVQDSTKLPIKKFLSGVENIVVIGFAFTTLLPLFLWYTYISAQFHLSFIGFIVIIVCYLFVVVRSFYKTILDSFKYNTWLVNFENIKPFLPAKLENQYLVAEKNKQGYITVSQKTGGVVILPITTDGKILLIENYRPRISKNMLELPRGFMEEGETADAAAKRELFEETNCSEVEFIDIGTVHSDSGLVADNISVVIATNIDITSITLQKSEHITSCKFLTNSELLKSISENEITDGFTLSAVSLAISKNHIGV